LLDILLNNLFSNAINHNLSPGIIKIELKNNNFTVSNTGILQQLDESRLFNRFYKAFAKSSRNGLGLSIVSKICQVSEIKLSYQYEHNLHKFHLAWPSILKKN
jgi:signal transduction histidine kinase